jgi:glycosyltransferase involved in cell wall biosynthesis
MAIEAARWRGYSDFIKNNLKIIVVDDGSKIPAHTLSIEYPANVEIYRVKKDVLWNEKGARNLGAVMAKTDWVIFTDFDHWFEIDDLERLLIATKQGNTAYRFQRYNVDGTLHPRVHSESFLIERTRALQAGGFSECFTGQYGAAPYQIFYDRFQKNGGRFQVMDGIKIYQRSNANNATRAGDITDRRKHDPNYGILHFEWERTL